MNRTPANYAILNILFLFSIFMSGFLTACIIEEPKENKTEIIEQPAEKPKAPLYKPADYSEYIQETVTGYQHTRLYYADNQNVHITLEGFGGWLTVKGGNHIVFTGSAKTDYAAQKEGTKRGILRIINVGKITGYQFSFDATEGRGLDALIVGNNADDERTPDVELYDFELRGGWNKWPYDKELDKFHGDAVQVGYGKVGKVKMVNGEIYANNQGAFLDPQYPVTSYHLENINIRYGKRSTGYGLYLKNSNAKSQDMPPTTLINVKAWKRPDCAYGSECPVENFTVAPAQHWNNGSVRNGNKITFPAYPQIKGFVEVME